MAVLGCHRAACTPPVANHLGAGTARDIDIQQRSMVLGRALPSQICIHKNIHEATGWHSKMRLSRAAWSCTWSIWDCQIFHRVSRREAHDMSQISHATHTQCASESADCSPDILALLVPLLGPEACPLLDCEWWGQADSE